MRQHQLEESREDGPEQNDSSEQPTSSAKNPAAQNPAPPNLVLMPNLDPSANLHFSTTMVPELFCKDVTDAVNEIQLWSKQQSQNWNQHSEHHFWSAGCPWNGTEKYGPIQTWQHCLFL
jgi:hypothetical protein